LGIEPLARASQFAFTGGVITFGSVGDDSASTAHGHPSIGLGAVVLVEAVSHLLLFR